MKVLFVDDEVEVRNTLYKMLTFLRYECKVAANGEEALGILKDDHFPIVITDVKMPGMDGIELLKRIKEDYPDLDVVITTAYSEDYTFTDMIKAGATDYILKPLSIDELEAKLSRIARERELKEKRNRAEK